ncbi:CHASE2 domain-containing protein, partial [Thiolapillus sp.]|uniref:CHASE2 domain-containing protein n=1 Tax=Thiolapillus sp. TaxID=2017437 RepID=UPI003AF80C33
MADRRRKDWGVTLVLGAALLLLAMAATWQSWFSELDNLIYDSFIRQMNTPVLDDIVVVTIDSKTLATLGRWPLPRKLHAELLEKITEGKPAVVAMDIIFSEPDLRHPQYDRELVESVRNNGRVVLPVVLERYSSGPELRESLPFPELRKAAAALGHVHIELEADGIAKSAFLMAGLDRPVWPALSLARVAGDWPESKGFPRSGKTPVYTDMSPNVWRVHRQVLIPFPASGKDISKLSYADVINGDIPANRFYNKYVLIGATAAGLGDNIPTPISAHGRPVSGVEFNAYVLNGLLQDRLIVPVSVQWQYLFNALLILLMLLLYRPRGWGWVYGISLLLLIVLGMDYLLLSGFGYWYPPVVMLVSIVLFFLAANGHLLRKLLRVLFEERRLSQTALTAIGEAVIRLDERGHILKFNPMAEKLSGMSSVEAEGKDVDDVFRLVYSDNGRRFSLQHYLAGEHADFHHVLALKNSQGDEYQVSVALSTVPGGNGDRRTTVMVLSDVTKEHALASEVTHRETHNVLTDLPNQDLIVKRLRNALARASMNGKSLAVVYLDIDYFSKINEARGIEVGNHLLQAVADKLSDFLGEKADIGHIGGDEFLLVLEEHKIDRSLEDMVGLIFALFARPLHLSEGDVRVSVTLGVSMFPEHGDDPELLIGRAGAAMHAGKDEGGGQIIYYEPGMQDRANRALVIEAQLHQALDS